MKLTPLFIVRESVSVEVCCCFFQQFFVRLHLPLLLLRVLPKASKNSHITWCDHTHTHTLSLPACLPVCLCVSENKKIRHVLDIHIRHSMLRFVSCCCCCLFYHLTIFSECLHPKNNFGWATFPGWLAFSQNYCTHSLAHTHTHAQRSSGMHKCERFLQTQKIKQAKARSELAVALSLLDQRTDNCRWRRHILLLFECNSSSNNTQLLKRPLLTQGAKAMVITQIPITHVSR